MKHRQKNYEKTHKIPVRVVKRATTQNLKPQVILTASYSSDLLELERFYEEQERLGRIRNWIILVIISTIVGTIIGLCIT